MCTKVENSVLKLLRKAHPRIKKSLKDPDMWPCVKDLIDDLVDELWPEIEEEVVLQLRMKVAKPVIIVPKLASLTCFSKLKRCLCCPYYLFRNWYLYSTQPCNYFFVPHIKFLR